jgi:tRNA modification GTPase
LERVLEDLYRSGVRPARPGEFTLRAFLAGKIDLVQAEAVLGVIDAHNDAELRTALDQLAGGISRQLAELRFDLIDLLSDLEAGLDFVEEDIEFVTRQELSTRVAEARRFVESLLEQSETRMTSATKPKVVLAGLPNAGKSTLFNHLARKPLALVSEAEGTTRDYLRADVTCRGVGFELIDTAGWEDETAGIAGAAQEQRTDQLHRAALVLWCSASDQDVQQQLSDDAAYQRSCAELTSILRVWTKCDLPSGGRQPRGCGLHDGSHNQGAHAPRSEDVLISAQAEIGLDELRQRIAERLAGSGSRTSAWLGMTAARCRDSLTQAAAALQRAEVAANTASHSEELLAVDLRDALDHLGIIVGAVYTDDLLDRIFSKFCIGK